MKKEIFEKGRGLIEKTKVFFSSEKNISKTVFSLLMILAFSFVFGQSINAQFMRLTGGSGWGYGYGYGYGYGSGFDGGTIAGYRTGGDNLSQYGYGYGYGNVVDNGSGGSAYNSSTGEYEVTPGQMSGLVGAGVLVPDGHDITSTTDVTFNSQVQITAGNATITVPSGTTLTASSSTSFAGLAASDSVSIGDLTSSVNALGEVQFGLPSLGLTLNQAVTINISVGTSYNGQTLTVYRKDAGGSWSNSENITCTVASGICSFTTNHLSSFAATQAVSSGGGGGGSSSGGGGGSTSSVPSVVKVEIASVTGNIVNLNINVTNASQMTISDNADFTGASWETYATTKQYTKKDGQTKLYAKFKSDSGGTSSVVALDIVPANSTAASSYPDGTLLKLANSPRVYVIIDGKKKWISTPEVFEQLRYQWTDIIVVTDTVLNSIPNLEDNLIRAIGNYKVYLVVNGIKRHIPNPAIFLDYGFNWGDVVDVDSSVVDKYQDAFMIKETGNNDIFYLNGAGIKKLITTADVLYSYGKASDVQVLSKKEIESYPLSNLIRLDGSNDIYLVSGDTKKHITSAKVFNKHKYNWNYIISVNQTDFNSYKDAGVLK